MLGYLHLFDDRKNKFGLFYQKMGENAFKTQNMGQWTSYFKQYPHITTLCHTLHTSWTN